MAQDEEELTEALTQEEARLAEVHRGFVREIDHQLGRTYGFGGAVVVAVVVLILGFGWFFSLLTNATLWLVGVTIMLASIYLVRRQIYAKRDRLGEQVAHYCEANELAPRILQAYYHREDLYPFFAAIYEKRPERLRSDGPAV